MTPTGQLHRARRAPIRRRSMHRKGAHRGRALGALCAAVAAVLCVLVPGATPAAAHAALTGTDPAEGSVVQEAPQAVTLDFSEGVQLADDAIRVLDPDGNDVTKGGAAHVDGNAKTATAALRPGLPDGTFTVVWKTVSADSHPISGAFTFSVGKPSKTTVAVSEAGEDNGSAKALYDTARYVAYGGFVLLVGGAVFAGVCGGRNRVVRRVATGGWALLFAATVALLLLRGPYTGADFGLDSLRDVLETRPGTALLSRLLLLGAAAVVLAVLFGVYGRESAPGAKAARAEAKAGAGADAGEDAGTGTGTGTGTDSGSDAAAGPDAAESATEPAEAAASAAQSAAAGDDAARSRDLAIGLGLGGGVVAVGLAATWGMAEHASTGIQPWLAVPMTMLHLLAVAVWLGGLASLALSLRLGPRVPSYVIRRFSRLALTSVSVLAATGLYQAWRGLGSWGALTDTSYGQLLLVKLGLVAVLITAGWTSRRWTHRLAGSGLAARAEEEGEPAQPQLVHAGATAEAGGAGSSGTAAIASGGGTSDGVTVPAQGSGARSGSGSGSVQDDDVSGDGPDADAGAGSDAGSRAGDDPDRAAQLARQRAAVDATRARKERDSDPVRRGLRQSVLVETGLAVVLLSVVTLLTGTQPGRAETEQAAAESAQRQPVGPVKVKIPYDTGGQGGAGTAEVTVDPGRTGDNQLHIYLTDANNQLLNVPEVRLSFTLEEKNVGPLDVTPTPVENGHWAATGVQLPMPGEWTLRMTVRTSPIDQVTEEKKLTIP
ncbi:copper resistance protein CopC/CopD [Streptomyces sp. NBC_01808]|uniref:copper resistance CopC/CopD family protein n=1 Tax=Streptomyces sp. NBC_01808 TaxID=2975947 RepID=UPI002DD7B28F|nr:copper resistance protein CopC [Streptomyces sp. NBC_01808]WSA38962.1 copper resistance protein CopC/CopD [Streptomyces sp. NBC_01808]